MALQCGILFVGTVDYDRPRLSTLRSLGFRVDRVDELPAADELAPYHVIVMLPAAGCSLTMLATRVRARAQFGRRILLALVRGDFPEQDAREARLSGFDAVINEACAARDLAAIVLRLLRPLPEYRCLLRSPTGRRRAA